MMNFGLRGSALMRLIASPNVAVTLLLAALLNPIWLSLIWTNVKSAAPEGEGVVSPNTREVSNPPEREKTSPVPVHAMHLRNPRRSMESSRPWWRIMSSLIRGNCVEDEFAFTKDYSGAPRSIPKKIKVDPAE